MQKLLDGVRVLELGNFISGPFAGQLLAELGAAVVKVEKPGSGDPFRGFSGEAVSPQFWAFNRGKRSISLDITTPQGADVLKRLVKGTDVLLENFRPDVLDRLGVGYEALRAINPALIYCNISGFGPEGPYARRPAYDTVGQAMSGFLSQMLDPDKPRILGPAMADAISGLYAAFAVSAALSRRAKDGHGHRLDLAMVEVMASFVTDASSVFFANGKPPGPYDRPAASQSFALRCADGKMIALHLSSPQKFWDSLMKAIERPDVAGDARFAGREDRVANYQALCDALGEVFLARPRVEWESRLQQNDVPFAPIYTFPEVMTDPHIEYLGTFQTIQHPTLGSRYGVCGPVWCDRVRDPKVEAPPELGHDTDAQLRLAGFNDDEIVALRAARTI